LEEQTVGAKHHAMAASTGLLNSSPQEKIQEFPVTRLKMLASSL